VDLKELHTCEVEEITHAESKEDYQKLTKTHGKDFAIRKMYVEIFIVLKYFTGKMEC